MNLRPSPRLVALAVAAVLTLATHELPTGVSSALGLHPRAVRTLPAGISDTAVRSTAPLPDRTVVFRFLNRARSNSGIAALRLDLALSDFALTHSTRMMRSGGLFHTSNLYVHIRARAKVTCWGENVGMGPTLPVLDRAFMQSAPHRANILARRFHYVGIGVVRSGGYYWMTMDFYG
jgi:uncharacterized protein YkwD